MKRFLFLASILSALIILSGQHGGDVHAQQPDFARAIAAQERHTPALLNQPGILGSGIGLNAQGEPVIRIFVQTPAVATPPALDNVPVERVVTGRIDAQCYTSKCSPPIPLGVSTGHPSITAGTIGARVKDGSGKVYALSNNHVFANSNNASVGDNILQPGPYDGGQNPGDKIGALAAFEPIVFGGNNNTMDAAIALMTAELSNSTMSGYVPSTTVVAPSVGLGVKKTGRTTALTVGSIAELNVTVTVCYEARGMVCFKSATFVNQFTVGGGTFSAGGDSGSLIVTNNSTNSPVGLLFAGSSTRTIANPIGPVLTRFGVTIDNSTGGGTPPPPDVTGPVTSSVSASPNPTAGAASVVLSATISDSTTGGSAIAAAEYFVGSCGNAGAGTSMTATDGTFNAVTETVSVTVDVTSLNEGEHVLYVRGKDSAGNWGNCSSTALQVTAATSPPPETGISLSVSGYKVRGIQHADLTWSGATSTNVDVLRDGTKIVTTDGSFYTDIIGGRGGGSFTYRICEAGTSTCSNAVTITF